MVELPSTVQQLRKVSRVDLRYNALRTPPPFTDAAPLRELYLGSNRLVSLDNCDFCPAGLQVLDVRDNKIKELGVGVARLQQLERLDVTNNDLNGIPPVTRS